MKASPTERPDIRVPPPGNPARAASSPTRPAGPNCPVSLVKFGFPPLELTKKSANRLRDTPGTQGIAIRSRSAEADTPILGGSGAFHVSRWEFGFVSVRNHRKGEFCWSIGAGRLWPGGHTGKYSAVMMN